MKTFILALLMSTSALAIDSLPKIESSANQDPISVTVNHGDMIIFRDSKNEWNCRELTLSDSKNKNRFEIYQAGCDIYGKHANAFYSYLSSGGASISQHEISNNDFLKLYALAEALEAHNNDCATVITLDRNELKITSMISKCDVLN